MITINTRYKIYWRSILQENNTIRRINGAAYAHWSTSADHGFGYTQIFLVCFITVHPSVRLQVDGAWGGWGRGAERLGCGRLHSTYFPIFPGWAETRCIPASWSSTDMYKQGHGHGRGEGQLERTLHTETISVKCDHAMSMSVSGYNRDMDINMDRDSLNWH